MGELEEEKYQMSEPRVSVGHPCPHGMTPSMSMRLDVLSMPMCSTKAVCMPRYMVAVPKSGPSWPRGLQSMRCSATGMRRSAKGMRSALGYVGNRGIGGAGHRGHREHRVHWVHIKCYSTWVLQGRCSGAGACDALAPHCRCSPTTCAG